MKSEYPEYEQGEVQELEKKLSRKNKKILEDFKKLCSITASPLKVGKVTRHIIQLHDITELDLDKQTKDSVNSFLAILNNSNRSIHTKNEIKSYLRKFLKWYYKDLEMIENIKTESNTFDYQKINENNLVTEEDLEKMLRFAENYKEKAFIFLSYEAGARPQEIVNIKWSDVVFKEGYAEVTFYSGKTRKSRTFPVKRASEFLFNWKQNYIYTDLKPSDFVFPSRSHRDKPMTTSGLNVILRRLAGKANLKKDFWNYLFRHTRATRLYEELPTPIVEQLMGHKRQYQVYAHISNKKAREEMLNKIYKMDKITPETKAEFEKKLAEQTQFLKDIRAEIEQEKINLKAREEELYKKFMLELEKKLKAKN